MLAGALLASGAVIKLWPALLIPLVLLHHRARGRVLAGSLAVGSLTFLAVRAYGGTGQLLSFLTCQRDRGLQVESIPALPQMAARAWGDARNTIGFAFGSSQIDGPWQPTMLRLASVGLVLTALATAALAVRVRRRRVDAEVAVVTLAVFLMTGFLVFNKVLSAQYPLWLAGLVCLALCRPGSPLRTTVAPLCGVLLLTQLLYPLSISTFVTTPARGPVIVVLLRAALLLVVLVLAARACWRLGSEQRVGGDKGGRQDRHAAGADEQHGVGGSPALGEPSERPDDREDHQVDARQ